MISFNVQKAGDQLLEHGIVYTMRRKRSEGWTNLFVMGEPRGQCYVELIGPVEVVEMEFPASMATKFVPASGFESVKEWMAAARRAHGIRDPGKLLIYRVTLAREEYGHGTS